LIYIKELNEHINRLRQVLEIVKNERLYANLNKCDFCMKRIVFLGYVINAKGIEMDKAKIKAFQEWSTPKMVSEVRGFHCLISFYKRFVKAFSTIVAPLTEIVKKIVGFKWDDD
jgi:hypothetical protein